MSLFIVLPRIHHNASSLKYAGFRFCLAADKQGQIGSRPRPDGLQWCFQFRKWAVSTQIGEHMPKQEEMITMFSGELVLFRRSGSVKGNWYSRIKNKDGSYIVRTTKTADIDVAREKAQRIYYEAMALMSRGIDIRTPTISKAFSMWVAEYWKHKETNDKDASIKRHKEKKNNRFSTIEFQYRKYIIPFMGKLNVSSVKPETIFEYCRWRSDYYSNNPDEATQLTAIIPSITSVKKELSAIRQLLNYCVVKGWISVIPKLEIPKSSISLNPARIRSGIEIDELDKLWEHKQSRYKSNGVNRYLSKRHIIQRDIVVNLLHFASHCALRPGELLNLKWQEITISKNEDGDSFIKISVKDGKTGGRDVVARHGIEFAIKELFEATGKFKNYVFCDPLNGDRLQNPNHTISVLLKEIGVDRKVVLYDARHTGITQYLLQNNDIYIVSLNCGTSVHHIQRVYSKVLSVQRAKDLAKTKLFGSNISSAKGGIVVDKILGGMLEIK